jgi:hypothetical protein
MDVQRRKLLQGSALLLAYSVGGKSLLLTPAQALAQDMPLAVLTAAQRTELEAFAEALVPGARNAGIAHYLDQQLACAAEDSLLMLRYLGVPAPYLDFYAGGLAAMANAALTLFELPVHSLNPQQAEELVRQVAADGIADWKGPPGSFFYFVLRADVTDVVYGTEQGFDNLGIPYSAHIAPARPW